MKYAHGIVSEYLADDIAKKLLQYLNIPEEVERKRKLNSPKQVTEEKKFKRDTSEEDLNPRTKALDLSKPEKVRY